jgi:Fe-S-cluster containining protein
MIIYLGNDVSKFPKSLQKIMPKENFNSTYDHYYTCKHHCGLTNNCLNYENRPIMCRSFPDIRDTNLNGSCAFNGCTKRFSLFEVIKSQILKIYINYRWKIHYYYIDNIEWCFKPERRRKSLEVCEGVCLKTLDGEIPILQQNN